MPYLTPQQTRLRDDIRGLVRGEVRCDVITQQLFSTDAGLLECRPQGVVWPRDIDDIVACVRYAAEKGIPIHPRGSGTGVTGEALGSGLILDMTRFMRQIVSVDDDSVCVQPGLTCHCLNTLLGRENGRKFGPVSGFGPATTVGSVLARNGAGKHWLRYGVPSDHVLELKVVMADGSLVTLNRQTLPQAIQTSPQESGIRPHRAQQEESVARGVALARGIVLGKEYSLADQVYRTLSPARREIEAIAQKGVPIDRSGYCCQNILTGSEGRHVDLARLILGSEGTLGLIVEARLKIGPRPRRAAAAILCFNSLEKATAAVPGILRFQPILCELVDRRRLNMVRDTDARYHTSIPLETEAILLVELDAGNETENSEHATTAHDRLADMLDFLLETEKLCFHAVPVSPASPDSPMFARFDALLRRSEQALYRMRRSSQAIPLFEDIAVPVEALQVFIPDLIGMLRKNGVTASISGHIGQGHLRVHPLVNLASTGFPPSLHHLAADVYRKIMDYDGTISSEYGTGLMKSQFIPRQHLIMMPIFQNIKNAFDPDNLFNPGKVVSDGTPWTKFLRKGLAHRGMENLESPGMETKIWDPTKLDPVRSAQPELELHTEPEEDSAENIGFSNQLELQLKWEPQRVFEPTHRCNGCGHCLRHDRTGRMCPMLRATSREQSSPRAKANLLRGVLEGSVELETLTHHRAKEIADDCFHCGLCLSECPAEVDVSLLAFREKSAYAAAHGLSLDDLFLARLDSALRWLSMMSWPLNIALENQTMRWILEKMFQIPQNYKLPKLAPTSFLSRVAWSGRHSKPLQSSMPPSSTQQGPAEKVALFVDVHANYFDSKLADWGIRLLEHNGLNVYVPPRQRASGLPAFATGHRDHTERLARHNTLLLADLIRQGYQVVTLEPASASCLAQDYRYLVDDDDAALLSSNVVDLCHFLLLQHRKGQLRSDFRPIPLSIGYHAPCRAIANSVRRVDLPTPAEELLRLIPELTVHRVERGCCGMAGFFGMKRKNYRRALQIGLPLFKELRHPDIDKVASDCSACLLQIEHGSKKSGLHPILLLAVAYGLAPERDMEAGNANKH